MQHAIRSWLIFHSLALIFFSCSCLILFIVRSPKVGIPDGDDLEGLSLELGDSWRDVGRRLGIPNKQIDSLNHQHQRLRDKGYAMLQVWTQMLGSEATYKKLYDALSHEFVNRQDLAEKFCLTGDQYNSCMTLETFMDLYVVFDFLVLTRGARINLAA